MDPISSASSDASARADERACRDDDSPLASTDDRRGDAGTTPAGIW